MFYVTPAVAAPMPEDAPVTITTFPFSPDICFGKE